MVSDNVQRYTAEQRARIRYTRFGSGFECQDTKIGFLDDILTQRQIANVTLDVCQQVSALGTDLID